MCFQSGLGNLIVPQNVIDEIKNLADEKRPRERSLTMTCISDGQYIRQEHTAQDIDARRDYIVEQLTRIEAL